MLTRRQTLIGGAAAALVPAFTTPAMARSIPKVASGSYRAVAYLGSQKMRLFRNGSLEDEWLISSARSGKHTPKGVYKPYFLSLNHKSSLYNNAPMPYSVFFKGNYATHGTNEVSRLGSRASAGCIRCPTEKAGLLFGVAHGLGHDALTIEITNASV